MQGHFVEDQISWVTQQHDTTEVLLQQISQYFARFSIAYLSSLKSKHVSSKGKVGSQPSIFRCDLLASPQPPGHQDASRSFSPHGGGRGAPGYLRNWATWVEGLSTFHVADVITNSANSSQPFSTFGDDIHI